MDEKLLGILREAADRETERNLLLKLEFDKYKVDWSVWKNITHGDVFECVCLSLDLDPIRVRYELNRTPDDRKLDYLINDEGWWDIDRQGASIMMRWREGVLSEIVDQFCLRIDYATQQFGRGTQISLGAFAKFCAGCEWKVPDSLLPAVTTTDDQFEPPIDSHRYKQRNQEKLILAQLKTLRYDPKKLPKRVPGKKWVKSEVYAILGNHDHIFTLKSFDIAWQRLRDQKEIIEAE